MTDPRRMLLAFLLMAAVLAASQWWYARMAPPPEEGAPADSSAGVEAPPDTTAWPPDTVVASAEDTAAASPADSAPAAPLETEDEPGEMPVPPADARPVVVETPLYRLEIDPRGGAIRQAALLSYPSFTSPGAVALVPAGAEFFHRVVELGDEERQALSGLAFTPSDSVLRMGTADSARTLTLTHSDGDRRIVQTYRFDPRQYAIDFRLDLGAPVDGVLISQLGPRLHSNEKNPEEDYGQLRAVASAGEGIVTKEAKNVDEGEGLALGGPIEWAGLRNKYFLAMLLAPEDGPALGAVSIAAEADSLPAFEIAVQAPIVDGVSTSRIYLGPQEYRRLTSLNDGLDGVNQYGWSWIRWMITPFAKMIVVVMLWLHQFIPSYGLVLIVFGLLVRIVMWPLTTKSFHSIRAMQELQPEIQGLRERYKSDPQRMQMETMRLYKERKVNPLGGCLPNLIPMPILFALFFVFQSTIEFRGQSFLWLPDLSQPDPFYILPILMGLTMMASSKMTTTDPRMNAMIYVMPIVLVFVFLSLAAGLVLYYAFSNLLTLIQQLWLKRSVEEDSEPESLAP